jgi:hypothetical protein
MGLVWCPASTFLDAFPREWVWLPQVDIKRPPEPDPLMKPHLAIEPKERLQLMGEFPGLVYSQLVEVLLPERLVEALQHPLGLRSEAAGADMLEEGPLPRRTAGRRRS